MYDISEGSCSVWARGPQVSRSYPHSIRKLDTKAPVSGSKMSCSSSACALMSVGLIPWRAPRLGFPEGRRRSIESDSLIHNINSVRAQIPHYFHNLYNAIASRSNGARNASSYKTSILTSYSLEFIYISKSHARRAVPGSLRLGISANPSRAQFVGAHGGPKHSYLTPKIISYDKFNVDPGSMR